jgi:hypothetical protein
VEPSQAEDRDRLAGFSQRPFGQNLSQLVGCGVQKMGLQSESQAGCGNLSQKFTAIHDSKANAVCRFPQA